MDRTGLWSSDLFPPAFAQADVAAAVGAARETIHVVRDPSSGAIGVARGGSVSPTGMNGASGSNGSAQSTGSNGSIGSEAPPAANRAEGWPLLATLPPLYPEWLGDRSFTEVHGVRFPYVSGDMANGIASTRLVVAMARAGFLAFFGAAGLGRARVEGAIDEIEHELGGPAAAPSSSGTSSATPTPPNWGSNLIHSPNEPALEEEIAELYIRRAVRRVSAAAYMGLTPHIVRYASTGLRRDGDGRIHRVNHVFAKISRAEVARHFMEPPPVPMLDALVRAGRLTAEEGLLARELPVAEDITVEADSGGHTDNRPLTVLFPVILALSQRIARERGYRRQIRVGAAGGLGTPSAVAGAFALGASYVLTGTVNQACVESGLSADGKAMLAEADIADVVMAPAADMFEMGVQVQVLKRGTMFGVRARKLYDLYRTHQSLDSLSEKERERVERDILGTDLATAWKDTCAFWRQRDASEIDKAERDPHHKMALVFRSYLGQASGWAISGDTKRRRDYQIWCGPAMGAFNAWVAGSFLEAPAGRGVVQVARNLMEGACVVTRAQQLRSFGVAVPASAFDYRPRPLA